MNRSWASRGVASLPRDRWITIASIVLLVGLAWLYLWMEAGRMAGVPMHTEVMAGTSVGHAWGFTSLAVVFVMWSVMMVGMMLPSAAPAILLYGAMVGNRRQGTTTLPSVWLFAAGYLAVWTAFSLVATFLQAGLTTARMLTPMMETASAELSASLLIIAGIYQCLSLKDRCLQKCRAPLSFLMFHWRPGPAGAFRMGFDHGFFCVGCCWALMLLLFAVGVMNLLWVALIAGFVLIEKLAPAGRAVGRVAGAMLIGAGVYTIVFVN